MRVFNQEPRLRFAPIDGEQMPGPGRPDRVRHADAETGHDRPERQQHKQ